ncbi:uncharacterized protein TrAtP1_008224 [Trichoderma atroviride]|uniref:uncharacterized protein n=1 Tax=Hypocrea atroviridis TaxID=63577 RepID=UPI003326452A|nr:hypothetical protein TrAtP1_008224 [Trichoderma atroviride]
MPDNPMLYIARSIAGVGAGAMSAIMPVYLAEIAPWKTRGRTIGFYQLGIAWGISTQYLIQYAAMKFSNHHKSVSHRQGLAFRLSYGIQLLSAVVLLLGLLVLPHSPRLYTTYDLLGSALGMTADLHAKGNVHQPEVIAQCREMVEEIRIEREKNFPEFRTLLRRPLAKRLFLGMSVQAWSQLCGMNIMTYNLVYVLLGTGAVSPFVMATIQYLIYYVCTVPAIYLVDKIGRRRALLTGSLVMMICLLLTGILQQSNGTPTVGQSIHYPSWMMDRNQHVTSAMISFSCIFVAAFAMTWGPISWIYPAEIFPTPIRPRAVALCTAARWCCNVAVALAVPYLVWALKYHAYYLFGMFNGCALISMYYIAYETKGYTLEEMHEVFDSGLPPWKIRQGESRIEALASRIHQDQQRQQQLQAQGRSRSRTEAICAEEDEGWPFRRRPSMQAQ